jgi:hypothetical protein
MTMAIKRRKRLRPNSIEGQFVPRLIEMLESPAWRVLSLSARRVIERIEIELGHHGGRIEENGKLPVTFDQFVTHGVERHSIKPAIAEASALGFIAVTVPGRAGNAEWRRPTRFRLTYLPAKGFPGNGCSHDWRCVSTMEQAKLLAKSARTALPKNKTPVRKSPLQVSGESPLKTDILGGESPLKNAQIHSGETHTTSIYLGEEGGGCGGTVADRDTGTGNTTTVASNSSSALHCLKGGEGRGRMLQ